MGTRPEILFPLFAPLETLSGIGPRTAQSLSAIDISIPRDLVLTLPQSGIRRVQVGSIYEIPLPATLTLEIIVQRHIVPPARGRPHRIEVEDLDGNRFFLVYFHARGDYLDRLLPVGQHRTVSGKVELYDGIAQMTHPDHVLKAADVTDLRAFEPIYPLTHGVTQKTMSKAVRASLDRTPEFAEWIDLSLREKNTWPDWHTALALAHDPQAMEDLSENTPPRRRLAYDELFAHQLTLALARAARRDKPGKASKGTGKLTDPVLAELPYRPTSAQLRAISEIAGDLRSVKRMNRLLQGDVGAGKTLVALVAMLIVVEAGGQAVLMAPTEVLARQHFESLREMSAHTDLRIEVLTGRDKGKVRTEKLSGLAAGDINILVGTHAVFQKDVHFQDLRLSVIDEQHRFGVRERMQLGQKGQGVDVLVMTATPIPRSLALASYGDMDVSILDEKPAGRQPITTALISGSRLDEVIAHMAGALDAGHQAYWVCPLVEESETLELTAAEERFKALRARFGEDAVALVHGQMPPEEKDEAMAGFQSGARKILVATTVIEVGVDVPNASIMVIEGAERFGLAQLHQLRGRVGRGSAKSSCLLMYTSPLGETAKRRLELMRETQDGFRIAEVDLEMRGAGDVIGTAQSGLPRFRIADLEHQAGLMEIARDDARALLTKDPELNTARGQAARVLLWLMGQDQAIRLISVG